MDGGRGGGARRTPSSISSYFLDARWPVLVDSTECRDQPNSSPSRLLRAFSRECSTQNRPGDAGVLGSGIWSIDRGTSMLIGREWGGVGNGDTLFQLVNGENGIRWSVETVLATELGDVSM